MMERAKTAPAPEAKSAEHEKPSEAAATTPSAPTKDASAEDRVSDLERRLNLLGDGDAPAASTPAAAATAAASAPAPVVSAAAPTKPQTGKNNPLLKRIQAAQERARQAEQQEKQAQLAAAAEIQRKQHEAEQAKLAAMEEQRIQKAQSALRSVAGRALEDKQKSILAQLEGKSSVEEVEQPTAGVPIMKSMDPLPPSFDSMKFPPPKEMQQQLKHPHIAPPMSGFGSAEMVGHGMNSRKISQQPEQQQQMAAPPSFDFVEHQMMSAPVEVAPPAPTAPAESPSAPPNTMSAEVDYLQGVQPVAPPPFATEQVQQQTMAPPPSFALFEQQQQTTPPTTNTQHNEAVVDDDGVFDYDLDGNPLTPAQREILLNEQRQLYESIMKEKSMNDEAIAFANADAFDQRSSNAAARAMPGGSATTHDVHNRNMDSVGRNVEAGAASDAAAASLAAGGTVSDEAGATDDEATRRASRRLVKIGNNQTVALHGQDRTKKAIKEGTAILVQCINCQNWMQVTDTATLMFCPVCQVVSPVIQQNEVLTKEEAIQLTMDRKLAEKLQAEAYNQQEAGEQGEEASEKGMFAKFFEGIGGAVVDTAESAAGALSSPSTSATAGASAAAAGPQSDTWWNKVSSIVGYGVADGERGEMGVTRPPGASASEFPMERRSTSAAAASSAAASPTHNEERRGLLSPVVVDGNEANLPSGRVAEQKPLFSCVMDSVSSATSAMFTTGEGTQDEYGVDSSSLLVTNAGRGVGDGAGDYSKLPDQE